MADRRISQLNPILADEVQPEEDLLALADISTNETKAVTPADLVSKSLGDLADESIPGSVIELNSLTGAHLQENTITERELSDGSVGTDQIADGSITNAKLDASFSGGVIGDDSVDGNNIKEDAIDGAYHIQDRSITGIKLVENTITSSEIASDSITAEELADGSVDTGAVLDDALTTAKYQNASVTNEKLASGIDGSKILDGSISGSKLEPGTIGGDAIGDVDLDSLPNAPANHFLAGPTTGVEAAPVYRPIDPRDLPTAKTNVVGAVSVLLNGGLNVSAVGALSIGNSVSPATHAVVSYDQNGLVTGGRDLVNADLPELQIEDIPDLSYDKITSGEIPKGALAECAVVAANLCDYSTCLMQEDSPGAGAFLGQFWYQPSTAQLRVYSRGSGPENIWLPVGFGALQANNLRWGGTYDADADALVTVTSVATGAGLSAGQAFPVATDQLSGMYFVCVTGGNNCAQPELDSVVHSEGDWALCVDATQGWVHVKTGSGSGGGGGAQRLNDLLDVEIGGAASPFGGIGSEPRVALTADDILRYDGGTGQWRNTDIIDGGSID